MEQIPRRPYAASYNVRPLAPWVLRRLGPFAQSWRQTGIPRAVRYSFNYLLCNRLRRLGPTEYSFRISGREIEYLREPECTERRVEAPVALTFVEAHLPSDSNWLEVGNTLHRFRAAPHLVVDKYETAPSVLNFDVLDYHPAQKLGLVVSVSTLEHVGFDEVPAEAGKFERAVRHLYTNCLTEGGWLLVTLPTGYNPEVDRVLLEGSLGLGKVAYLRRISRFNTWREVSFEDASKAGRGFPVYGVRYPGAEMLAVWEIEKPG